MKMLHPFSKILSQFGLAIVFLLVSMPSLDAQAKKTKMNQFDQQVERTLPSSLHKRTMKKVRPDSRSKKCLCRKNITQNSDFRNGPNTNGSSKDIDFQVTLPDWNRGTNTPKYSSNFGYSTPGFVYLWGNKVVSESIKQRVFFEKGKTYKGCFAFKYIYSKEENPSKHIRFKLLASKNSNLETPQCSNNECNVITTSQTIVEANGWRTHYFEWTANDDYHYLFVTPENDETRNSAEHISHGYFDDLCIEEKTPPCPPLKIGLMKDLFNHVPSGPITASYKLEFNENSSFASLFQSYLDDIKIIDPSIEKLVSHWRLIDAGNGPTPNNVYSPMIQETFSWFEPDGGGIFFGNTNFFTASLNVNQWYKIHTGIYTEPNNVLKKCRKSLHFFYRIQISNGKLIGTISDGNKVLKRLNLGKVKSNK